MWLKKNVCRVLPILLFFAKQQSNKFSCNYIRKNSKPKKNIIKRNKRNVLRFWQFVVKAGA